MKQTYEKTSRKMVTWASDDQDNCIPPEQSTSRGSKVFVEETPRFSPVLKRIPPTLKSQSADFSKSERPAYSMKVVEGFATQEVEKYLSNTLIQGRYKINSFIDKGSYGQVVSVTELGAPSRSTPLIMKIVTSTTCFKNEVLSMNRIYRRFQKQKNNWRQEQCPSPEVVDCGFLYQKDIDAEAGFKPLSLSGCVERYGEDLTSELLKRHGKVNAYIIMPRYGMNVADFFVQQNLYFSISTVLDLGCRVVEQLRAVHKAGYVYNDLKPDNVMIEYLEKESEPHNPKDGSIFEGLNLHLIDFGFCSDYKERTTGRLQPQTYLKKFRGNLRYASADQLAFKATGRKDDFISLLYMMVILLNKSHSVGTPIVPNYNDLDSCEKMAQQRRLKEMMSIDELCSGRGEVLKPFAKKVMSYSFYNKPDYDELISLLEAQMRKQTPSRKNRSYAMHSVRSQSPFSSVSTKAPMAAASPRQSFPVPSYKRKNKLSMADIPSRNTKLYGDLASTAAADSNFSIQNQPRKANLKRTQINTPIVLPLDDLGSEFKEAPHTTKNQTCGFGFFFENLVSSVKNKLL